MDIKSNISLMMTRSKTTSGLLLISSILIFYTPSQAQYYKQGKSNWSRNWAININMGRTSFFGDVSLYDDDYADKLDKESSLGYGMILSKRVGRLFEFQVQLLKGGLKGKNSKAKFTSDIFEYTFNTALNLANLLLPDNKGRFTILPKIGIGQFRYSSRITYFDSEIGEKVMDENAPEFVMIFGGTAYYSISPSFVITVEATGRLTDNDKIDGYSNNNKDKDYYSYLSIGITYNINNVVKHYRNIKKTPLVRKY